MHPFPVAAPLAPRAVRTFFRPAILLSGAVLLGLLGCKSVSDPPANISQHPFGRMPEGTPISVFTLRNQHWCEARICNYGGLLLSLKMPDRHGHMGDVVLGYDNLDQYIKDTPYFGALIGRYGNRIAKGQFTLDGRQYTLATNNYPNSLHGGVKGFDKVVWIPSVLAGAKGPSLKLTYLSHDGEEGYPANLSVT
ncbi:MAG: galactose-1-epimerase, partial [Limisphaerales bacterium]